MDGKSSNHYDKAFYHVEYLLERGLFKMNWKTSHFDFESGIKNSFCKYTPNIKIEQGFFHFMQIIWRKLSKKGFRTKENFKLGKKIEFTILTVLCFPVKFREYLFDFLIKINQIEINDKTETLFAYFKNGLNLKIDGSQKIISTEQTMHWRRFINN